MECSSRAKWEAAWRVDLLPSSVKYYSHVDLYLDQGSGTLRALL
jgi:hypothetical protein